MRFVYDASYALLLLILSPWIAWRYFIQHKNRRGWSQKLLGRVPTRDSDRRCIWIHAVSVGEVNLLVPLIAAFRARHPEFEIAVSTTTETGFDLARQRFPHDLVFFCPTDFSWAVNNALHRIRPDILMLTELELWPNLITLTRSRHVPVVLINGRISERSFRGYRRFQFLVGRSIRQIDLAIVQTETYAQRLIELGLPRSAVAVCGNIKFDGAGSSSGLWPEPSVRQVELARLAGIVAGDFVFLAGSTQENEDRICISVFKKLLSRFPQLRLILVPRHPDRCPRLAGILREQNLAFAFRSELNRTGMNQPASQAADRRVLVVDVIGELAQWWGLADAGYVGGSIGNRGGQSMIEPASWGVPISFGPDTENFRELVELLLEQRAAVVVENEVQLLKFVDDTINNPSAAREMGHRAQAFVARQTGAAAATIQLVSELLERTEKSTVRSPKAA